jgi:hypothetical protein
VCVVARKKSARKNPAVSYGKIFPLARKACPIMITARCRSLPRAVLRKVRREINSRTVLFCYSSHRRSIRRIVVKTPVTAVRVDAIVLVVFFSR